MTPNRAWRHLSIGIGAVLAGIGCYGAWEYAFKLEGTVSYLVVAAPVIAVAAALIPPLAEHCWRERQWSQSVMLWLVLIPAAATMFFAAAERVHSAKAGAAAERASRHSAANLAKQEYQRDDTAAQDAAKALGKW